MILGIGKALPDARPLLAYALPELWELGHLAEEINQKPRRYGYTRIRSSAEYYGYCGGGTHPAMLLRCSFPS